MFKIAEEFVCHLRVIVEGGFIKSVPGNHPCGIIGDGSAWGLFDNRCGRARFPAL